MIALWRRLNSSQEGRSRLPIGLPLSETTKSYSNKWASALGQLA
jgi:hypothetical protein